MNTRDFISRALDWVWEIYTTAVVAFFTVFLFLAGMPGGRMHVEVNWHTLTKLYQSAQAPVAPDKCEHARNVAWKQADPEPCQLCLKDAR